MKARKCDDRTKNSTKNVSFKMKKAQYNKKLQKLV